MGSLEQKTKTQRLPKITLESSRAEKSKYEALGDLFAIVTAMEHLEKAYITDSISEKDYQKQCNKLIAQYKTLYEGVKHDVSSLEAFMQDYHMSCRAAAIRFTMGVPATMVHGSSSADGGDAKTKQLVIFKTVQHFITCMDTLKLNMNAVDELHPTVSDLMESINKINNMPNDHIVKEKVRQWLLTLSQKKAHEELSEEEVRQMSFDLENAYNALHKFIQEGK